QKQKKLIMLPSETMIWQPEFTDKTLSRKPGAVHRFPEQFSIIGKLRAHYPVVTLCQVFGVHRSSYRY
ncbi:hypothetical protein CSW67_27625, partial [Shigella boydii]